MTYDEFAQLAQNNTENGYVEYSEGDLWFHISQFDSATLNIPAEYSNICADLQFDQLQSFQISVLASNDAYSVIVENTWNGFKLLKYKNTTPISSVAINEPTKFSMSSDGGTLIILFDDEVVFSYDLNKILSLNIGAKGLPGNVGNILKLKNVRIIGMRLGFYGASINKASFSEQARFPSFVNTHASLENIEFNSKINTNPFIEKQSFPSYIKGILCDFYQYTIKRATITVTSNANVQGAQILVGNLDDSSALIQAYRNGGLTIKDSDNRVLPFQVLNQEYFVAAFKADLVVGENKFYVYEDSAPEQSIDYWQADVYDFENGVYDDITDGWTDSSITANIEITTEWAYNGTHSLKLTIPTAQQAQGLKFKPQSPNSVLLEYYHLGNDGTHCMLVNGNFDYLSDPTVPDTYITRDYLAVFSPNGNFQTWFGFDEITSDSAFYIDYIHVLNPDPAIVDVSTTDLVDETISIPLMPPVIYGTTNIRTSTDKLNNFSTLLQKVPHINDFVSLLQLPTKLFNSASTIQLPRRISLNNSAIQLAKEVFSKFDSIIIKANNKEETNFISHVKGNVEYEIVKHYPSVVHSYQLSNYQSVIKNANSFETGVYTSVILKLRSFRYPILITLLHYYDAIDDFSEPYDSDSYYNDIYDTELNYVSINQEDNPSMDVENYTVYTQWGDGWLIQKEVDDVYSLDERSCVS